MGGIGDMISGAPARRAATAQKQAQLRAEQQQKTQEAIQLRATIAEDKRAEKIGTDTADLMRTAAARRSGKNSLSFASSALKSTLGA